MEKKGLIFVLAFFAVLFSLTSLFIGTNLINSKIQGYATSDTANVTLEISSFVRLNFTLDQVSWGTGKVATSFPAAHLNTLGVVDRGTWSNVTNGLMLENIGNYNVTLNLTSSSGGAAAFIGGTGPEYYMNITNNESGSCNTSSITFGEWISVGNTLLVCDNFLVNDNQDSIRIDFNLTIPSDSITGQLSDVISAVGTAV